MTSEPPDESAREQRLGEALTAFLEAVEQGREPDRAALLARYPELAGELAEFFADWERFDRAASPLRSTTSFAPLEGAPGGQDAPAQEPGGRAFGDYVLLE